MLNVAVLIGRLTADPELKHTTGDIPVTSFTLAVNRGYVKSGSERQADFIDIVCWRNTAEFVSKYFHKGQLVAVEGSIQTRTYEDKQGSKRKVSEIVANRVEFVEPKKDGYSNAGTSTGQPSSVPALDNDSDTGDFVEIAGDDDLPF